MEAQLFASTPQYETVKLFASEAMTRRWSAKGKGLKLGFLDVRRAHLRAKAQRDVFIDLPDEDATPGMRGRLLMSLSGTRDAAANWEKEYTSCLLQAG